MTPRFQRRLVVGILAVAGWSFAAVAQAQYADLDRADWKEDPVPPAPAYDSKRLIPIELSRSSVVRVGIDPQTLSINQKTGVVRYVVVAQGASAVNAFYEGIRCSTGEYRVYARQVQGGEWSANSDDRWRSMRGEERYPHPFRLARDGLCLGTALNQTTAEMVRALRSPKGTLYPD